MDQTKRIRLLCVALVSVVLTLALIMVVAVCGGMAGEVNPEEDTRRSFLDLLQGKPVNPQIYPETFDWGDMTLPDGWQSGLEWPTLSPSGDESDGEKEWTTIPGDWETLPQDWETLPPDWEAEAEPDIPDKAVGMNGDLARPDGALGEGVAENLTIMNVFTEIKDRLYLKMQSFGDYTGTGFAEAEPYGPVYQGWSADILPSMVMADSGYGRQYWADIEPVIEIVAFPYYLAGVEDGDLQTSDVLAQGSTDVLRRFYYQRSAPFDPGLMTPGVRDFESGYRKYVYDHYTWIDDTSYAYLMQIVDLEGFDPADPDIINKVAAYIQGAATYDKNYNENLDREENIALAFLGGYKRGVCRHFAAAATLLYRTLGIPARYTVGFAVNAVPDECNRVAEKDAHAWVEVYVEGFGWRCVEVTGSVEQEIEKIPLTLTPVYMEKMYDGLPMIHNGAIEGFEEYLAQGYRCDAKVVHDELITGSVTTTLEFVTIQDPFGNDVTDAFDIYVKENEMVVFFEPIYFASGNLIKEYDGTPLTVATQPDIIQMVGGVLQENYYWEVVPIGSRTSVGISRGTYQIRVLCKEADGTVRNMTRYFKKIYREYGTLEITRAGLTLKAADKQKPYDGSPLTANDYEITGGGLAEGDYIAVCDVVGSQTTVGRKDNIIERVVILNQDGEDVTGNYAIELLKGVLRVTLR